jgi:hypothetical protein
MGRRGRVIRREREQGASKLPLIAVLRWLVMQESFGCGWLVIRLASCASGEP